MLKWFVVYRHHFWFLLGFISILYLALFAFASFFAFHGETIDMTWVGLLIIIAIIFVLENSIFLFLIIVNRAKGKKVYQGVIDDFTYRFFFFRALSFSIGNPKEGSMTIYETPIIYGFILHNLVGCRVTFHFSRFGKAIIDSVE